MVLVIAVLDSVLLTGDAWIGLTPIHASFHFCQIVFTFIPNSI